MKILRILILVTVLLIVVFCLSRMSRQSSNPSQASATVAAKTESKPNSLHKEKKPSTTNKQQPQILQAASAPLKVADGTPSREIIGSAWKEEQQLELKAFAEWTDRFLEANDSQRAGLISEGLKFAEQRRLVLAQFIRSDPERALAAAVPLAVRAQLPTEITNLLEERVSGRGDLPLLGVTPAPGQSVTEPIFRSALVNRHEYRAFAYGRRAKLATLSDASVIGIAVDGALAVSDSPLRVLEAGEQSAGRVVENVCVISGKVTPVAINSPLNVIEPTAVEVNGHVQILCEAAHIILYEKRIMAAEGTNIETQADGQPGSSGVSGRPAQAWTHGTKKVLIIRVDFSDLPGIPNYAGQPITEDYAVNLFSDANGVRDYYQQGSFGKTSLQITPTVSGNSPDVTEVLRMPHPTASYTTNGFFPSGDSGILHADARAAAQASGIAVDTYDRVGVVFNGINGSQLGYAGLGELSGKNFWINGAYDFRVVTHEIGHNYGIWHANLWQVTDGNPVSDTGTHVEYGDSFDIMGGSGVFEGHFSHWNKSILQWIPDTAVPVVTNSGTYRVYRFDHQNANLSNTLALKIVRDSTRDYWIGYRRATTNPNLNNGAYILWGYNVNQGGHLLDMTTPGNDPQDAALAIGAGFSDTVANVSIRPLAQGGTTPNEYLDVQITFGSIAPIITTQPLNSMVTPGQSPVLLVRASAIPAPSYQWQRQASGTTIWVNLTNGSSYSGAIGTTLIVNSATISMDGDQFRCVVSNASGSVTSSPAAHLTVLQFGVTTLAGQAGISGYADGTGSIAQFSGPFGVAVDRASTIYVADSGNSTIRKIIPTGAVSTLAGSAGAGGSADGIGGNARFNYPYGITVDSATNVYVADLGNQTIRKVTPDGNVTTLAGLAQASGSANGLGSNARFSEPHGIAVDGAGNLYVADSGNKIIRKITPAGMVSTLAGLVGSAGSEDGTTNQARFWEPTGVASDSAGNVFVSDYHTIRKITPDGFVTTLAGQAGNQGNADGIGFNARFSYPEGLTVDTVGNVYVADRANCTIRKVTPSGEVSTLFGEAGSVGATDGMFSIARFNNPFDVEVDTAGNLYVADTFNNTIRKIVIAPTPQLTGMNLINGVFRFVLHGSVGSNYVVQVSSNLVNWVAFSTNIIPANGWVLITDTNVNQSRRFYRAVLLTAVTPTISLVSHIDNGGLARSVVVAGNYAYLANEDDGLRVYGIANPLLPVNIGQTNNGSSAWSVAVAGNFAYLANFDDGLRIYNISNPTNPANVSHIDNGNQARGIAVAGSYAYLANYDGGLRIYNVANPANPVSVGVTNNGSLALGVAVAGNYAYLANDAGGLRIYNISNPTNLANVGHINSGGAAKGVTVSGNYVYLANGNDGLRIYNVSNPANPIAVGHIYDGGQARSVAVQGNYAFLANLDDGLRIYDISNPASPVSVGHIDDGGTANGVAVSGNYVYLANSGDGLRIYFFSNGSP